MVVKLNILLVHSLSWNYKTAYKPVEEMMNIQLGLSYISSFLKSKGHVTKLLVLTNKTRKESVNRYLKEFDTGLICFTAVSTEYNPISKLARYIKRKYPSIFLVVGGPHASLNPEKTIQDSFDALCIGEGEYPLFELAEQLEKGKKPSKIKNLWIKQGEKVEKNPTRKFIQKLDDLPFPDRDIWKRWKTKTADIMQVILVGRGCPFQCTYCCNHVLRKLSPGTYVRFRSMNNILKEVKEVITKFPKTKEIYFEVETIGANMKLALELCSKLEKFNKEFKHNITYGINLRIIPKTNYNNLFKALKKANFKFINIGLESGSKRVREKILKRYYSNQDIIQAVKLAKKYNLKVNVANMIGFPGETLKDFKETINCLRECQPDEARLSIFFPYPGTELYKLCKEKSLLNYKINMKLERRRHVLNLPGFSRRDIKHEYDWFYYNVYKGHKPLYNLLASVMYHKLISNYFLYSLSRKIRNHLFFRKIKPYLFERLFKS